MCRGGLQTTILYCKMCPKPNSNDKLERGVPEDGGLRSTSETPTPGVLPLMSQGRSRPGRRSLSLLLDESTVPLNRPSLPSPTRLVGLRRNLDHSGTVASTTLSGKTSELKTQSKNRQSQNGVTLNPL